jgi:hypothetical protein
VKSLADINYEESIATVILKELEQNIDFIEKIYPFSPGDVSPKKPKRNSNLKDRIPLCSWTMPAQPEGYIRAGKYDFL